MGPAVEHKHEWTVRADAWYMKVYKWVWDGNPQDADFCKLWWAFFPPFLLIAVVANIVGRPTFRLLDRIEKIAKKHKEAKQPKPPKPPKEPSLRLQKLLLRLEVAGVKTVMAIQKTARGFKRLILGTGRLATSSRTLNTMVLRIAQGAMVLIGVGSVILVFGLAAYQLVQHINVVAVVTGILAVTLVAVLATVFFVTAGWAALVFRPVYHNLVLPTRRGAKAGGLGFVEMLKLGYVAVKSNTCPRITIKE